jgi:hypothetical protein
MGKFKFKVTFITGDEVEYVSTQSELKFATREITEGKFITVGKETYSTANIFKFEPITE